MLFPAHVPGLPNQCGADPRSIRFVALIGTNAARRGVRAEGRRVIGDPWAVEAIR